MPTPTALPAAFTAGDVLTAANMNLLLGGFRILQVVFATTTTQVTSTSNVFVDSNLTATITPTSATSKVLVSYQQNGGFKTSDNASSRLDVQLLRTSTVIQRFRDNFFTGTALFVGGGSVSAQVLDSPATTSAVTYKTQIRNAFNGASAGVQASNTADSTITLMEVSA